MASDRTQNQAPFAGERMVKLSASALESAVQHHPALGSLRAVAAGFVAQGSQCVEQCPPSRSDAVVLYCVKGTGWCELRGRRHTMRPGDLAILPPRLARAYASHRGKPWTIHWIHAAGDCLEDYLDGLGVSAAAPVRSVGDDLQMVLLFSQVYKALQHGRAFPDLILAAHALGHLLALAMQGGRMGESRIADSLEKVAQCIIHMSEHLEHPPKVRELAALAGLSHAHFTALFKEQTGSAPREYLQLLRMHRASEWLAGTNWSLKEIARRLGYQDPFHFSRQFKVFNGVSPSAYRQGRRG